MTYRDLLKSWRTLHRGKVENWPTISIDGKPAKLASPYILLSSVAKVNHSYPYRLGLELAREGEKHWAKVDRRVEELEDELRWFENKELDKYQGMELKELRKELELARSGVLDRQEEKELVASRGAYKDRLTEEGVQGTFRKLGSEGVNVGYEFLLPGIYRGYSFLGRPDKVVFKDGKLVGVEGLKATDRGKGKAEFRTQLFLYAYFLSKWVGYTDFELVERIWKRKDWVPGFNSKEGVYILDSRGMEPTTYNSYEYSEEIALDALDRAIEFFSGSVELKPSWEGVEDE